MIYNYHSKDNSTRLVPIMLFFMFVFGAGFGLMFLLKG